MSSARAIAFKWARMRAIASEGYRQRQTRSAQSQFWTTTCSAAHALRSGEARLDKTHQWMWVQNLCLICRTPYPNFGGRDPNFGGSPSGQLPEVERQPRGVMSHRGCFSRDPNTRPRTPRITSSPQHCRTHHCRPAVTCAAPLLLPMCPSGIRFGHRTVIHVHSQGFLLSRCRKRELCNGSNAGALSAVISDGQH